MASLTGLEGPFAGDPSTLYLVTVHRTLGGQRVAILAEGEPIMAPRAAIACEDAMARWGHGRECYALAHRPDGRLITAVGR